MTAWQVASTPFWISGACFCFAGLVVALTPVKAPETLTDKYGQCGVAMTFGLPFMMVAAWMWS